MNASRTTEPPTQPSRALNYQRALWGIAAIAIILIVRQLIDDGAIESLQLRLKHLGNWAPFVLGVAYVFATVLFVPGTLLSLVAGAAFSLPVAFITISLSSTIGAAL
ncbi:MAG: hypothetical protein KDA92_23190, partial [Planctomycetales bacterium]|nr:hypothetical protein [Planctomycetales bacterium]